MKTISREVQVGARHAVPPGLQRLLTDQVFFYCAASCLWLTRCVSSPPHLKGSCSVQHAATSAVARWWHFEKEKSLLMLLPLRKNSWMSFGGDAAVSCLFAVAQTNNRLTRYLGQRQDGLPQRDVLSVSSAAQIYLDILKSWGSDVWNKQAFFQQEVVKWQMELQIPPLFYRCVFIWIGLMAWPRK